MDWEYPFLKVKPICDANDTIPESNYQTIGFPGVAQFLTVASSEDVHLGQYCEK